MPKKTKILLVIVLIVGVLITGYFLFFSKNEQKTPIKVLGVFFDKVPILNNSEDNSEEPTTPPPVTPEPPVNQNTPPPTTLTVVPVFLFLGESNAASPNYNDTASVGDLRTVQNVRIVNNANNALETINIPVNSCLNENDNTNGTKWGWEVPACNIFTSGGINNYSELIIIKAAQPGSTIGQWNYDIDNEYFSKMVAKINIVKSALAAEGKTPKFFIFFSQGINNQRNPNLTDPTHFPNLSGSEYWGAAAKVLLEKTIENTNSEAKVCITKFWWEFGEYCNAQIDAIVASNPKSFFSVTTSDLTIQSDRLHTEASSTKNLFERMLNTINISDEIAS